MSYIYIYIYVYIHTCKPAGTRADVPLDAAPVHALLLLNASR